MTMSVDDDWSCWIGHKGEIVHGPYPVSAAAIGYLAEALEDERLADLVATGNDIVAPRSFVNIASRVPNWIRKRASGPRTLMQAVLLPLPADAAVNMGVDQVYLAPLRVGDRIGSQSTITAITPKRTRLGEGFIVTEEIDHRNQDGVIVGRTVNNLLRYTKTPPGASIANSAPAAKPAPTAAAAPGDPGDFPMITMPITMTRLVTGAAAVRDFSLLHHDIDFARGAGHPTAFLSYSFQLAVLCRALGEWLGGDDRVRRLKVAMKASMYLGKTLTCRGARKRDGVGDAGVETIELTLATEDGTCTTATAEVASGS
jgi:acyl dehydratase